MKTRYARALGLLLLIFLPCSGYAIPTHYSLMLNVDLIIPPTDCVTGDPGIGFLGFGCDVQEGDIFYGNFSLNGNGLAENGSNQAAELYGFRVRMNDVLWDNSLAYGAEGNSFDGFRGPNGLGSQSPGFNLIDGLVVSLTGGVYSPADPPYLDFIDSGVFYANDGQTRLSGSYLVQAISINSPGTSMLIVAALLLFAIQATAKKKRASRTGALETSRPWPPTTDPVDWRRTDDPVDSTAPARQGSFPYHATQTPGLA